MVEPHYYVIENIAIMILKKIENIPDGSKNVSIIGYLCGLISVFDVHALI